MSRGSTRAILILNFEFKFLNFEFLKNYKKGSQLLTFSHFFSLQLWQQMVHTTGWLVKSAIFAPSLQLKNYFYIASVAVNGPHYSIICENGNSCV